MNDLSQIYSEYISLDNAVNITLFLVFIVYLIYSVVLVYHWKSYSTDVKITGMTLVTYFSTTIPLLIIMTILAFVI
jgi:heme/copper-type cytochrome/quinol oxidase subunit 2